MIEDLTPGFRPAAMDGQLSLAAISVLRNTILWTDYIDHGDGLALSEDKQKFLTGFDPRANGAQVMRLCRVSDSDHRAERSICMALFIYHANILNWTNKCSGLRLVIEELGDILLLWDFGHTWDKNLLIWLCFITGNAARRANLARLHTQLMDKAMALSEEKQTWEVIHKMLESFLVHSRLDREWKMCWNGCHP